MGKFFVFLVCLFVFRYNVMWRVGAGWSIMDNHTVCEADVSLGGSWVTQTGIGPLRNDPVTQTIPRSWSPLEQGIAPGSYQFSTYHVFQVFFLLLFLFDDLILSIHSSPNATLYPPKFSKDQGLLGVEILKSACRSHEPKPDNLFLLLPSSNYIMEFSMSKP